MQGEGAAGTVEAVIIPVQRPRSSRPQRTTLCISSQVGCAQNCQFCLTGRMGLRGNLSTAQIVEQVTPLLTPLHCQPEHTAAELTSACRSSKDPIHASS